MTFYDWVKKHFLDVLDESWCCAAFIILKSRKFLVDDEDLNGGVQYTSETLARLLHEKTGKPFITRNQVLVELAASGKWPLLKDEIGPKGWMIVDPGPSNGMLAPIPEGQKRTPRDPYMKNPDRDWSKPPQQMLLPVEVDGVVIDYWINPAMAHVEAEYRRQKQHLREAAEKILTQRRAQGWLTSDSFLESKHPGRAKVDEVSAAMQAAGAGMNEKYYSEKDLRGAHPHGT